MERKDAIETLPWMANHSLDETERERLEQALERDPDLQKELTFQTVLRDSVKANELEPPGERGLALLKRKIPQERKKRVSASRGWRNTAIATSILVAVQATVMVYVFNREDIANGRLAIPVGESIVEGSVLQIQFAPDATEAKIRKVLQESNAVLIDGPSELGIYLIRVPSYLVVAALQKLQSRSGIVAHVSKE